MHQYQLGSDAKTVSMARDLFARVITALEACDEKEFDRLMAVGLRAVNRPFRVEFLALVNREFSQ